MLLLDAVSIAGPDLEALRKKASRQLVTVTRRIQEVTELGQPLRLGSDLLGELARRAQLRRLTGDVKLSRGQLEQRLVDRSAVLADKQHVLTIALERHDTHGSEGPHDLALEGETVRADESAYNYSKAFARVSRSLTDLAKSGTISQRGRRGSCQLGGGYLRVELRRGHCLGRTGEECVRAPG